LRNYTAAGAHAKTRPYVPLELVRALFDFALSKDTKRINLRIDTEGFPNAIFVKTKGNGYKLFLRTLL
jgi:hypothetical protein